MKDAVSATRPDPSDFHRRWAAARRAALREAAAIGAGSEAFPEAEDAALEALLATGAEGARERIDRLHRAVFLNSRKLGMSLSRRLGLTFEAADFRGLLEDAAAPACYRGAWEAKGNTAVLRRAGCGSCAGAGADACDYWREALDGLVIGLGDRERLVRHACSRRGDGECLDVIFLDGGPRSAEDAAWAAVPEHMALDLLEAAERFRRKTGMEVALKGVHEGVLHYVLASGRDGACAVGDTAQTLFGRLVHDRFPGLALLDVTPRAVISEKGG